MYQYVSKSEVKNYRSVCSQRLLKLTEYLKKEYAIKSQLRLFGSASSGMFTKNGDQCVDLDYNIRIQELPAGVQLKKMKDASMNQLTKLFSEPQWSGAQDSTSAITLTYKDMGKVVFRLDVAFILPNTNGTACKLIHDKKNGLYTWNEIPQYKDVDGKAQRLKNEGLWPLVRETYLAKKNMYLTRNDSEHISYVIYIEAVNEVYSKPLIKRQEEEKEVKLPLEQYSSNTPVTYYVDYENVGSDGLAGIETLGKKDKIVLLFSDKSPTIRIDIMQIISERNVRISFRKVVTGTPNALDFQLVADLTHHLGPQRNSCIISKDTGYDAVIPLLNSYKVGKVSRYSCIEEYKILKM